MENKPQPTPENIPCSYCGLPLRGVIRRTTEPVFCCLGCAMADSVSGGGEGPNVEQRKFMGHLLVAGFLFFNQAFFLLLSLAFRVEGKLLENHWSFWVSQFAGLSLLGLLWWLNQEHGHRRSSFFLGFLLAVALLGAGAGWVIGRPDLVTAFLLMLSAFAGWCLSRGLVRKVSPKR
ncbi:MAG: hypothetical protein JJT75_00235 [Opitutales bacterium]|nr:hypothetical protein [Opitutales bacterium]MCH8539230.1 hypothetical protein [Opitutales bacterium]